MLLVLSYSYNAVDTVLPIGNGCSALRPRAWSSLPSQQALRTFPLLRSGTRTAERPGGSPGAEEERSGPGRGAGQPRGGGAGSPAGASGRGRAQPGAPRPSLWRPLAAGARHHRALPSGSSPGRGRLLGTRSSRAWAPQGGVSPWAACSVAWLLPLALGGGCCSRQAETTRRPQLWFWPGHFQARPRTPQVLPQLCVRNVSVSQITEAAVMRYVLKCLQRTVWIGLEKIPYWEGGQSLEQPPQGSGQGTKPARVQGESGWCS